MLVPCQHCQVWEASWQEVAPESRQSACLGMQAESCWGLSIGNVSLRGQCFFKNLRQFFRNNAASRNAWGLYSRLNHCRRARPTHVGDSGPQARLQVLQNIGSLMLITRVKPFHREIATGEFVLRERELESTTM